MNDHSKINKFLDYTKKTGKEFSGTLQTADDAPDAVDQYRGILAGEPDNSVVIVSIGYLAKTSGGC